MKHIHSRLLHIFSLSALLLTLSGCGQKGALYLADEEAQTNTPQQQQTADKKASENYQQR